VKVLVVEDSPTVRAVLTRCLKARGAQVHAVSDGRAGVEASETLSPDVILMDLQLPRLSGLEAITEIMMTRPRPIVVLSGQLARDDVDLTFQALRAGAVDVMEKPGANGLTLPEFADRLYRNLRLMCEVRLVTRRAGKAPWVPGLRTSSSSPRDELSKTLSRAKILLLGASTGGPPMLASLLSAVRAPARVPIVIAQHISPGFGRGFAHWLGRTTGHRTVFVDTDKAIDPGTVYLASAAASAVFRSKARLGTTSDLPTAAVQIHPNVDLLFESAARHFGAGTAAVLLTGMGRDGAHGLKLIRERGGATLAQDETSSVVFGMPRVAHAMGAVDRLHSGDALHLLLDEHFSARRDPAPK